MREGQQVREALAFLRLLWNHPVLTVLLILVFTPPFFPLVVYFSPLLMSTGLFVVALISMDKIKAGGGPVQLENHLDGDVGVSSWLSTDRPGNISLHRHLDYRENYLRNLFNNIHIAPVTPLWIGDAVGDATTTRVAVQLQPQPVENNTPAQLAAGSDDDWWDNWVKEYESRPGWGEQQDQSFATPAIQTSERSRAPVPAPAPATIPSPITVSEESNKGVSSMAPGLPIELDKSEEERPSAPSAAATVTSDAASNSNLMKPREELLSPLQQPLPSTRLSFNKEEVVEAVKFSDLQAQIFLTPIRTDRGKQVDRNYEPAQEMYYVPSRVDGERVSAAQALKAINKLLSEEKGKHLPANSLPRNAESVVNAKTAKLGDSIITASQVSIGKEAISPQLLANVSAVSGEGHVMGVQENRIGSDLGISTDVFGENSLRHLKTSRSENHSRTSMGHSPFSLRTSRGLKPEKFAIPLHFSPRLLQGSQHLAQKGISPRLPNLTTAPLGNPVDKVPQWMYNGIPKESAGSYVKRVETAEEINVKSFEQGVKVLSHRKKRTHARRPLLVEEYAETLHVPSLDFGASSTPGSISTESVSSVASLRKRTSKPESGASSPVRVSGTGPLHGASVIAESIGIDLLPIPIFQDFAAKHTGSSDRYGDTVAALIEKSMLSKSRASAASLSPSLSSEACHDGVGVEMSSRNAPGVTSPRAASTAASLRDTTTTVSTHQASVMAVPRQASGAASPRSSSVVTSTNEVMLATSSQRASITASPRQATAASNSQKFSVPSSPSVPHSRRRLHSSKYATDQLTFASSSPCIEVSHCASQPGAEKEKVKILAAAAAEPHEGFTVIEKNVMLVESKLQDHSINAAHSDEELLHLGSSLSPLRSPTGKSRRRLESRRVVTSEENDMFWKTNLSRRVVESSSDDERESVTPRMARLIGRTVKPLVWRSRSIENREDSD